MIKNIDSSGRGELWKLDRVSMRGSHGYRLEEVSLVIPEGITAVIGPSGAGKTSFLNILASFEKYDSGRIIRGDDSLSIFWVPQNNGLWSHLNVAEHLAVMMVKSDNSRIDKMLELFEMSHKKTAYPSQLSKGEQSRLAMARALIVPHDILIMDEPLSNIAPASEMMLWNRVLDVAEESSTSIIYATHSPKHVLGTAENVICLNNASIVYSGSVEVLYFSPSSHELGEYLGEINWFSEDVKIPIQALSGITLPAGVRPEQVRLKKYEGAPFKVINSVFRGEITETLLEDVKSGESLKLLHRSVKNFRSGESVDIVFDV
jgi:ABC-type Fe3+/spermidine/putrescine transport system ATPase subunit